MNIPKISICIPTYNRAECLRQCLQSIVDQFGDPTVRDSIEVVVSDNASADATESVAKGFQRDFSNILYYRNSENIGVDRNILNVAEKAQGECVWFLGDDDALFPDAIDYMLQELKLSKFKYCLANCLGYDSGLVNPALRQPNFAIESNQYFASLKDCIINTDKNNLVGFFCGLSGQIFDRKIWQAWPNKQAYVGSNAIHLHTLLLAMKDQSFAMIAKPLVKTRSANIRWESFVGLETLSKRAAATSRLLQWILENYDVQFSKTAIKANEFKDLFKNWLVGFVKKYLFKSQSVRNFIKKMLGKL